MKRTSTSAWILATICLLVYMGLSYLLKMDLKLALLILIAYHVLKADCREEI